MGQGYLYRLLYHLNWLYWLLYQLNRLRLLLYRRRSRWWWGRVEGRPPWTQQKVDLVVNKGGFMRKVNSKLGLGASEHGGEGGVSSGGSAGGAAGGEERLDATGDLLVRHHGVGKAGEGKLKLLELLEK
jgi:hypothetical protein